MPVVFIVVGTWPPALPRLPVQLKEHGTKTLLCHDIFTILYAVFVVIALKCQCTHFNIRQTEVNVRTRSDCQ